MTEIICFLSGATVATAIAIFIFRKWQIQNRRYMDIISGKEMEIRNYQVEKAYRDGLSSGDPVKERLMSENVMLIEQNRKLSSQIGTESIFSNAVASQGGAAVMLRRSRSSGGAQKNE